MSLKSFLKRGENADVVTRSHKRSVKQESELAKELRGRRTPGSGSKSVKGDVRCKGILRVEAKTTKNKSFSVTLDMIHKIEEAALSTDEVPAIVVEFNDGNGRKIRDVAVVPMYVLQSLLAE